jgi:hypothetical protein
MTFKELMLQQESSQALALKPEPNDSLWRNLFVNQSPVMKLWFWMMLVNFLVILWML